MNGIVKVFRISIFPVLFPVSHTDRKIPENIITGIDNKCRKAVACQATISSSGMQIFKKKLLI
jgi:hypothetical protein